MAIFGSKNVHRDQESKLATCESGVTLEQIQVKTESPFSTTRRPLNDVDIHPRELGSFCPATAKLYRSQGIGRSKIKNDTHVLPRELQFLKPLNGLEVFLVHLERFLFQPL